MTVLSYVVSNRVTIWSFISPPITMKRHWIALVFLLSALSTTPLLAQTRIGGGTCNSSSLNGTYAVSITGRQVTSAGTFMSVFQANGSANFDGQNKVTMTLTANTLQSVGTPLTWSGTYSLQANCVGTAAITSGGAATLNIGVYNQGSNFLLTGSDATYTYSGSGNGQPSTCSTSLLSGVYAFNATGFSLSGPAVNGVVDATGQAQFDGRGNVTINITSSSGGGASNALTATGTYSVSSNCLGSATVSDSKGNAYVPNLSISAGNANASTDLFTTFAQASKFVLAGGAHSIAGEMCTASSLNGTYTVVLGGRAVSSTGTFAGAFQGNGTASFDGQGKVTLTGTSNTNQGSASRLRIQALTALPPIVWEPSRSLLLAQLR